MLFACLTCNFCMFSSTVYHLFNSISEVYYYKLLKIDLMGIGINICGLAVTLIYTGFHNYWAVDYTLVVILGLLMGLNLILQMTPCYMQDKHENLRTMFYVVIIVALLGVTISWIVFVSTHIEINLFVIRLILSFVYLGIGFFFYISKYPERVSDNYYV